MTMRVTDFRCKAFLFDLDGVLVDSRAVVERTWQRWAAERHPIDLAKLLHVAHGRRARDTLLIMAPHLATDEEVAWLDATELADRHNRRSILFPGEKSGEQSRESRGESSLCLLVYMAQVLVVGGSLFS